MISAPTRATFEIATIMKTIDITLSIDVALSKTLPDLMAKNIEIEKMSFAKDMPLPSYSSDNCSGLDLYAANKKNLILKSGKTVIVSSGIKIALKNGRKDK